MATWPDLTEYHEALQYPERSLGDPELQKAQIEKDRFGMPKPATGGNAVVYKASEGQNVWAVRCFLRPISDHAERYAAISKHLQKNHLEHATRFFYLGDGLRIKGGTFPIVKMAWVQGQHLDRCVQDPLARARRGPAAAERCGCRLGHAVASIAGSSPIAASFFERDLAAYSKISLEW